MTDKEKLDAIRAEIHRLVDVRGYDKEMANALFAFMDSLPSEPYTDFTKALAECIMQAQGSVVDPMVHADIWENELIKLAKSKEPVSDVLEEAAKIYARGEYDRKNPSSLPWQCKGCYSPLIYAFKDGAQWQKEQMMAKAVDALVHTFDNGYIRVGTQLLESNEYGLKVGDKVKVIIVKEE